MFATKMASVAASARAARAVAGQAVMTQSMFTLIDNRHLPPEEFIALTENIEAVMKRTPGLTPTDITRWQTLQRLLIKEAGAITLTQEYAFSTFDNGFDSDFAYHQSQGKNMPQARVSMYMKQAEHMLVQKTIHPDQYTKFAEKVKKTGDATVKAKMQIKTDALKLLNTTLYSNRSAVAQGLMGRRQSGAKNPVNDFSYDLKPTLSSLLDSVLLDPNLKNAEDAYNRVIDLIDRGSHKMELHVINVDKKEARNYFLREHLRNDSENPMSFPNLSPRQKLVDISMATKMHRIERAQEELGKLEQITNKGARLKRETQLKRIITPDLFNYVKLKADVDAEIADLIAKGGQGGPEVKASGEPPSNGTAGGASAIKTDAQGTRTVDTSVPYDPDADVPESEIALIKAARVNPPVSPGETLAVPPPSISPTVHQPEAVVQAFESAFPEEPGPASERRDAFDMLDEQLQALKADEVPEAPSAGFSPAPAVPKTRYNRNAFSGETAARTGSLAVPKAKSLAKKQPPSRTSAKGKATRVSPLAEPDPGSVAAYNKNLEALRVKSSKKAEAGFDKTVGSVREAVKRVYNKVKKAKPVKGKVRTASKSTFLRHDDLFAHLDKRKFPTHHMATITNILEKQEAAKGQASFDKTIGNMTIDGVPKAVRLSDWIRSSDPDLIARLEVSGGVPRLEFLKIMKAEFSKKDVYSDERLLTMVRELSEAIKILGDEEDLIGVLDVLTAELISRNIKVLN